MPSLHRCFGVSHDALTNTETGYLLFYDSMGDDAADTDDGEQADDDCEPEPEPDGKVKEER